MSADLVLGVDFRKLTAEAKQPGDRLSRKCLAPTRARPALSAISADLLADLERLYRERPAAIAQIKSLTTAYIAKLPPRRP